MKKKKYEKATVAVLCVSENDMCTASNETQAKWLSGWNESWDSRWYNEKD